MSRWGNRDDSGSFSEHVADDVAGLHFLRAAGGGDPETAVLEAMVFEEAQLTPKQGIQTRHWDRSRSPCTPIHGKSPAARRRGWRTGLRRRGHKP
ncbi:hypothetical protein MTO96_018601 [Rhipicephalus appendiculatus]